MRILAFDAGLGPFAVALEDGGHLVGADRSASNDALERGLQRIAALLADAGLRPAQLDRIAVGIGPGSFTGIRIALSYAKALAYAAGVPLVGISSYDILTPPDYGAPCLAVVSGRPGVICARLTAHGVQTVACGAIAAVLKQLLHDWNPAAALGLVTNAQDDLCATGEAHPYLRRLTPPGSGNTALALARLARDREPAPSPHIIAPDYGEIPAVTMPKARTRTAP